VDGGEGGGRSFARRIRRPAFDDGGEGSAMVRASWLGEICQGPKKHQLWPRKQRDLPLPRCLRRRAPGAGRRAGAAAAANRKRKETRRAPGAGLGTDARQRRRRLLRLAAGRAAQAWHLHGLRPIYGTEQPIYP
jgi:hypothetical protein